MASGRPVASAAGGANSPGGGGIVTAAPVGGGAYAAGATGAGDADGVSPALPEAFCVYQAGGA
ncbi:hypothetical protein [Streptomyces uncialis]|uniref:hypothetical protein n=1 Tax=Streptomyces uncialis TaxID=1048205 RepID=UPI001FEB40DD